MDDEKVCEIADLILRTVSKEFEGVKTSEVYEACGLIRFMIEEKTSIRDYPKWLPVLRMTALAAACISLTISIMR